jgi:hypothetical protein
MIYFSVNVFANFYSLENANKKRHDMQQVYVHRTVVGAVYR